MVKTKTSWIRNINNPGVQMTIIVGVKQVVYFQS